jgi:hypothetical protein
MSTPVDLIVPSSTADRDKLFKVIKECSGSLARVDGERTYIKEAIGDICKELNLPKRLVNRLLKVYHKQNFEEETVVNDQFQTLYETVVK